MNAPQEHDDINSVDPSGSPPGTTDTPRTTPPYAAPESGARWTNAMDPRRKSVALASVLSLMPGLGQIYVGFYQLGFTYILIVAALITVLANNAGPLTPLFGLGLAFFWLYNVVDAGRRAALYNTALLAQSRDIGDFVLPLNRGSRVGGVVLAVIGALFLMHTRFGFDMYWVEDWWPLGLIALGAWLFLRDRSDSRGK